MEILYIPFWENWHKICWFSKQDVGVGKQGGKSKMERKLSDWIIIILILLFFAIPICSLAVTDPVYSWPKCATSFIYNFFLK
jgi:hypothetical protein